MDSVAPVNSFHVPALVSSLQFVPTASDVANDDVPHSAKSGSISQLHIFKVELEVQYFGKSS